jgi:hypothetical protein
VIEEGDVLIYFLRRQWMLIDTGFDAGTKLDAATRRSDLGCAQHEFGQEA